MERMRSEKPAKAGASWGSGDGVTPDIIGHLTALGGICPACQHEDLKRVIQNFKLVIRRHDL